MFARPAVAPIESHIDWLSARLSPVAPPLAAASSADCQVFAPAKRVATTVDY